jgi:hypothetical protein
MAILKFRTFQDQDQFEMEGKGINWQFEPDASYLKKILRNKIRTPFPPGIYKFSSFEEAESWEREWWIKNGPDKRIM